MQQPGDVRWVTCAADCVRGSAVVAVVESCRPVGC